MQTTPAHGVHIDWEAGESIQIGGFGTRVRVPAAMTNGSTTIVEHTLAAGTLGSPLHRHSREDETSYVLEGVLSVQVGDEVLSAGPREIVVKLKGEFHAFWNAGETPLRFLEVISPGGFEAYFAELARIVPRTVLPRWARSARSGRASPRVRLRQYRRADGASRCAPRMSPASSPSVSEGDAFRHRRASGPRPPGQVSTHTGAVGHVVDTIAPRLRYPGMNSTAVYRSSPSFTGASA